MALVNVTLPIVSEVTRTSKTQPVIGVESGQDGFAFDFKRLVSDVFDSTAYLETLGEHLSGLLDGTAETDWVSGVVSGMKFNTWINTSVIKSLSSTPVYESGDFTIHWDLRHLFSDYSVTTRASVGNKQDGRFVISLDDEARTDSIDVRVFKRTETAKKYTLRKAQAVESWSDDTYVSEFMVDGDLYVDESCSQKIGFSTTDTSAILNGWERHVVYSAGQAVFTNCFPVDPETLVVKVLRSNGDWDDLTQVDNLNFSRSSDLHYSLNADTGALITGGYSAPDLRLRIAVDEDDTIVDVFETQDLASYPPQGIITIGTEEILYLEKTSTGFGQCLRGYNSTAATSHSKGDLIEDIVHGASAIGTMYMAYTAVPRIEYEVTGHKLRSANAYAWLKLEPTIHLDGMKIVQLSSTELNLARIVLTTDRPLIGGNLYGPVLYGTDLALLTATAYDFADNPVPGILLTIEKLSGPGFVGDQQTSDSGISNSRGQFNTYFNAPYDQNGAFLEVLETTHVGGNTHMRVANLAPGVTLENVAVFQVLKHDNILGTVGDTAVATASGLASAPYGAGWVKVKIPVDEEYVGGTLIWIDDSSVRRSATITRVFEDESGASPVAQIFIDEEPPVDTFSNGKAYLIPEAATTWNPLALNGVNVVLYEWRDDWEHPITGDAGAWAPLIPDSVSGDTFVFNDRLLPIPDPFDDSNSLGAYRIVAPAQSKFQAYGTDPFSGRLIVSNKIRLQLELPSYLQGVDRSGALPIPRGFTFVTDDYNVGAGLGGTNFLTINPSATGVAQFSFNGVN